METEVVNIKYNMEYDIYIGRSSKWGNPFKIGCCGKGLNRAQVLDRYRGWIVTQQHLMDSLCELKNKRLGCYCKPLACHGDILVELVNKYCN
jgi:hypothetical protein